ncbi:BglG family transcription antiterminator [Gottfriedia solisilvae]|uniref:BglG family transcription antiterminator n=1 Tax=Gottfriedia solisilvae TaxID=1516104 RepID=UPI003D2EAEE8
MDKSTKRRLQIINILSSNDKWYTSEELASELSCTEKTIRNDIQSINLDLPNGWEIETIKGKGIYIKKPISASINEIRSLFVRNSVTFRAILYIQFKQIKNISGLASALYAQEQAIYKLLGRVEALLNSYSLQLKRGPLQIIGREFDIRLLCCDMLDVLNDHTAHTLDNWPFENISFSKLKEIVTTTTDKYKLFIYPATTNKYIYFLATMLYRIKKEIDLNLNSETRNRIVDSHFFKISDEICNEIENVFNVNISLNERIAFTLSITTLPYYSFDETEKSEFLTLFYNKKTSYYNDMYQLVERLEKNLGIPLLNDEDFLYTFQSQFKRYSLVLYSIEKIEPSYPLDRYTNENYPELFNQVRNILFEWTNERSYPELTKDGVAKVTLNIQATKIKYDMVKQNILLLTSNGPGVYRYISTKLIKEFGHKMNILQPKQGDFEPQNLDKLPIEFIIADFQLDINTVHPVIIIDPTLTQRDINQISILFHSSIDHKKNRHI